MIQSINQAGGGGGAADEKVKVSANDTTEGYLNGKLVAGTNVTLTENNNGSNETLTITSTDTNDAAKVSANDTTAGFLNGKLVAGTNITFTENNDGANETLTIAASGLTGFTASQNTASPNNTVNASRLLVDATSTNADAVIQPKGTGALLAQLPDSATAGGNKRGTNATDIQTSRNLATQIASGVGATIVGGRNNTASGNYSIVGGEGNISSGLTAVALGSTLTSSGLCSFAAGELSIASGDRSIALNNETKATGPNSFACGSQTESDGSSTMAMGTRSKIGVTGALAHASGRFGINGDCQYERHIVFRSTTTNTVTELTAGGAAASTTNRILIASDATYTFTGLVTARRTDADNESAGYRIEGVIDNNAGTTAFVGTPTVTVIAEDTAAWDVAVVADNTNDALLINVTGENAKTIRWGAVVELMKVSG